MTDTTQADETTTRPVVLPGINKVTMDAPWAWLAAGWRDVMAAPSISLTYGAIFTALSVAMVLGLLALDMTALVLALAGGFLLIGPLLAVGLYEASRRLSAGEPLSVSAVALVKTAAPSQLAFIGVFLMLSYLAWARLALLIFALFYGINYQFPPLSQFLTELFFTWQGLGMLIIGTGVGAGIAFVVFAFSAVSLPMLLERDMDAVSAVITSVRAVRTNFGVMALWAGLIAVLMAAGIATGFVGLVITFPLVGHATWHAYRQLVATTD